MTVTSERELIRALWKAGYYADRTPASGKGVKVEGEGHTASPDVWAVKSHRRTDDEEASLNHVLFFEDKHVQKPNAYLDEEQVEGLKNISQRAGAVAIIAVKWKHTSGHVYAYPKALDRTRTGRYVFRHGTDGTKTFPLSDITQP
jgi:Holliday junction resolvase